MDTDNEEIRATAAAERRRRPEAGLKEKAAGAEHLKLAESNRRLAKGSQTKSDFLANLNHELHTSLNSVIGFSNVLLDQTYGPINEKQQEYIQNILVSGKRLLSLYNDILDLSRVDSGNMELELGVFSLRGLLDASLVMLREKAAKGSVTLCLELAPPVDFDIVADQRKLKQIMFNLLSNAVTFTPIDGTVAVNARKAGDSIEISVTNAGIGIRPEDIPKLFQELTQAESDVTDTYEDTGMGLPLTKQLIEMHGGSIRVTSAVGVGSSFIFNIPLLQA